MRRALALAGVLLTWIIIVALRLYDLQVIQYVPLLRRGERQQQQVVEIAPARGTIYDRNQHPLAMSLPADSIYAAPREIAHPRMVAALLAPILKLDRQDLIGRLKTYRDFCWIKRKVSRESAERVRALGLKGIYFEKEMKRFYPQRDLAAQVLGYVGMDDNGLGGLEYTLNNEIKGQPGRVLLDHDAHDQSFRSVELAGKPGANVTLTLDETIQFIAERELAKTIAKYHAAGGVVIVQNPHTGAILAMASQPTFNPNHFERSTPAERENRGVEWLFEPGSTMKMVTITAALEEGLANPDEVINCEDGQMDLAGTTFHDWHPFGDLTVAQVLMHSSEIGAAKIGMRLGDKRLYDWLLRFGFDQRAGDYFAGEEQGILAPPNRWSGVSIGDLSTGQGVSVTALQMVDAYSTVANGGVMMAPRIVRSIENGGQTEMLPVAAGRRIVSRTIDEEMKQMLEGVVVSGTGEPAQLDGYSAAGKTGTAQKINAQGRYSHTKEVASFIGFAPVSNPAITVLVAIDTPVGAIYGDEVAAPAFKVIAEQTLSYLGVPQDQPSRLLQVETHNPVRAPRQARDARSGNFPSTLELSNAATTPMSPLNNAFPAGADATRSVVLDEGPRISVPDFSGQSARQVVSECQALGFDPRLAGLGVAVAQAPAPGALVPVHSSVWVRLER